MIIFIKYENSKNTYLPKRNAIAAWRKLSVEFVSENSNIETLAEQIVQTGVKPYDALHLACAIESQCDYFITVDKRILKYKTDKITIYNPLQFVSIYKEGDNE